MIKAGIKAVLALVMMVAAGQSASARDWADVVERAEGQTVYWNAWGGDEKINGYIAWVADRVGEEYGIDLRHVKLSDTAEAVSRVLAEKTAGRDDDGSIDLLWINGENFAAMKRNGLLFGPFTDRLPNDALVADGDGPRLDFTVPVDGLEAPWGRSQLVFLYDSARVPAPPGSVEALAGWIEDHPGRFTYPAPPDFLGTTFLKQVLIALAGEEERAVLSKPAEDADFDRVTRPLWAWLDRVTPHLWRGGKTYPASGPAQRRLLDDAEVDYSISFHPGAASSAIEQGLLPASVRTFVLKGGTIGNTHFIAIPYNARAKEGAMVVANFLLSPRAQARKLDPRYWGDMTVLDTERLAPADRARFDNVDLGAATLRPDELGTPLPEPHPSWMTRIEQEWQRRYAN